MYKVQVVEDSIGTIFIVLKRCVVKKNGVVGGYIKSKKKNSSNGILNLKKKSVFVRFVEIVTFLKRGSCGHFNPFLRVFMYRK